MKPHIRAKLVAPVLHAILFATASLLWYTHLDTPLADGPAAWLFIALWFLDAPISLFAFGVMFTSEAHGTAAWIAWGVLGTLWWYLVGRFIIWLGHRPTSARSS